MTKSNVTQPDYTFGNQNHILKHTESAHTIHSAGTYPKYLPEATSETHMQFLQAS